MNDAIGMMMIKVIVINTFLHEPSCDVKKITVKGTKTSKIMRTPIPNQTRELSLASTDARMISEREFPLVKSRALSCGKSFIIQRL